MTVKNLQPLKSEISKAIIGQTEVINELLIALLSGGHVLIEGVPGLAKTLIANTFAKALSCDFKRIQFTPDLLPADLIGTTIWDQKTGNFSVQKGPIFTNILLADEINRAPAKVQSALLEVMQEKQVTIRNDTFPISPPFWVLATQNPIEHEGTYPLSEAQTDRFLLKVNIDYPSLDEEREIVKNFATLKEREAIKGVLSKEALESMQREAENIFIDDKIVNYILQIVAATRDPKKYGIPIDHLLLFGASPRASLGLKMASKARAYLQGRDFVTPDDIKEIGPAVLRHRLRRTYEAEAEEVSPDQIIATLFDAIPVP